MEALILLATIMALFGVIGYLRGAKSSLFTAIVIGIGLVLITQASGLIARTVKGLTFAVTFVLAGGLGALGGEGDRGAALNAVIERMPPVKTLVNADGTGIGMVVIFLLLVAVGLLIGMLKVFKTKASLGGLFIGLANGYVVSAFVLSRLLPGAGLRLPLLGGLTAPTTDGAGVAPSAGPSLSGTLIESLVQTLNALVEGGQIALLIALLIVIFVLLATRLGNRKK